MYEFHPYFTSDGSVGLYNKDFDDIYHSADGALSESYDKFILPLDFNRLLSLDNIKILDICYGIGYNSKSFLNFIFENIILKNFSQKKINLSSSHASNIVPIHTNNIFIKNLKKLFNKCNNYTDTIYDDNIFGKIYIKAIDNDKKLIFLSPFIKTGEKKFHNKNLDFNYEKIEKYLKSKNKKNQKKINKLINYLIFEKIAQKQPDFYNDEQIMRILYDKRYNSYFAHDIRGIYSAQLSNDDKFCLPHVKSSFLHNIYYKYISNCYKKALKHYKLQDICFDVEFDDARQVIKNDNNTYNIIFLDAFSPNKCPCLWSYDFFKELYKHLDENGMLLTYSTSAPVRNAMIQAGFYIGQTLNLEKTKSIGTIAVKNKSLIKYPLTEYDLGLLKTRAGIFYRDENLTALNEAIISARNLEVGKSDLITSSQYNKAHKEKEWSTI